MAKLKEESGSPMNVSSVRELRRSSARLATRLVTNVSHDIEEPNGDMEVDTPPGGVRSGNRRSSATARPRNPSRSDLYNASSLQTSTESPSSISSLAIGSVGEPSSRYTTPGTSVAVTPRDSALHSLPSNSSRDQTLGSRPRVTTAERLRQLNSKRTMPIRSTKRKREFSVGFSDSEEVTIARHGDVDVQLARALQLEEDGERFGLGTDEIADFSNKAFSRSTRAAKKSRVLISDSDEENNESEDDDEDTDEDDEVEEFKLHTKPATKKITRSQQLRRPTPTPRSHRTQPMQISSTSANQQSPIESPSTDGSDLSSLSDFSFHHSETESNYDSSDSLVPVDLSHNATIANQTTAATAPPTARGPRGGRWARAARRSHPTRAERDRLKLEKHHPELRTMWEDLQNTPIIPAQRALQPVHITRTLKPFQLEGLNWMVKQEKTKFNGGLLGDEMGMGKTIQAVSLIMSDYPAKLPSLVLVPPVALMQWQSEIGEYTDGKLKVLVYHGASKDRLSKSNLKKYNVVLMTYSGLETIFRRQQKGFKRGRDLIKEDSVIHSITWHRVILDEAHSIKSRNSNTSKACFALKANHKWCLSGTPLQNRIGELFSLLKFLEITPFAYYMCKTCPCKEIHWNFLERRKCSKCRHGPMDHVSLFNKELLDPIQRHGNSGAGKKAFGNLQILLDRVMLRRLKKDHVASMELPPKRVVIHREVFNEIELDLATSIMTKSTRQFDNYVAQGVMLNNYANIFGLIMQMRQVADHPDLLLRRQGGGDHEILVCEICNDVAEEPIQSKCRHTFCRRCIKNFIKTFAQTFEDAGEPDCPRCHITLSIDLDIPSLQQDESLVKKSSIINRIKMENWTSSTKIEMLVYDLYKLRSSKQTHKSIVFSQFTSMLQLIEWRLRRAGLKTVMLDGTMTPSQRAASIKYFMENVDVEVFLVSLKAGGVALNLTEASRVFIVDPWWNPATEWQSADRCHRIGQRRPCVITRLCIEDSVESRMVLLQEKKANMINGTMNADQKAMESLTPEDMEFLFRGT